MIEYSGLLMDREQERPPLKDFCIRLLSLGISLGLLLCLSGMAGCVLGAECRSIADCKSGLRCQKGLCREEVGSVWLGAALRKLKFSRVRLTVTGPFLSTIQKDLVQNKQTGSWQIALPKIPWGKERIFSLEAFDEKDITKKVLAPTLKNITIEKDKTTILLFVLSPLERSSQTKDYLPTLKGLLAQFSGKQPGKKVQLQMFPHQTEAKQTLRYQWTTSGGTFSPTAATTQQVEWHTPPQSGQYELKAILSNDKQEQMSLSMRLDLVSESNPFQGLTFQVSH